MSDNKDTNDALIKDLLKEKDKYELELFQNPSDQSAKLNLQRVKSALKRLDVDPDNDASNKKMKDGGMAGGKRTPHMYSTEGSVVDNLPNEGLKKLAKSGPAGKKAVRNMGFDVA